MRRHAAALLAAMLAATGALAGEKPAPRLEYAEGQLLILIPPQYPPEALARGEASVVEVQGRVLIDGSLQDMKVASNPASPALEQAVREVAGHWRLHPRIGGGCKLQETDTKVTIWFEIAEGKPKVSYSLRRPEPLDPALIKDLYESALRQLRQRVPVNYPRRLLNNRNTPDQTLQVAYARVESDGTVSSVSVAPRRYYKSYEDEIVYALSQWRFEPSPKGFCAEVPIHFKMVD